MRIRRVKKSDLPTFVIAYLYTYSSIPDYHYSHPRDVKNYFKWLLKRDPQGFFVAEEDGEVLGFVASDARWEDFWGHKVLEIHEIFVVPSSQGKGIGTKLMEKALAYGRSKKRKLAELWVGEKNLQAQRFYEKLGFTRDGKWGKWIRYTKSLEEELEKS